MRQCTDNALTPFRVILVAKFKQSDRHVYIARPFVGEPAPMPRYERHSFFDASQGAARAFDAHDIAYARLIARLNVRKAA